jgi:hypothetical protein
MVAQLLVEHPVRPQQGVRVPDRPGELDDQPERHPLVPAEPAAARLGPGEQRGQDHPAQRTAGLWHPGAEEQFAVRTRAHRHSEAGQPATQHTGQRVVGLAAHQRVPGGQVRSRPASHRDAECRRAGGSRHAGQPAQQGRHVVRHRLPPPPANAK